jgi:hypothetical protein
MKMRFLLGSLLVAWLALLPVFRAVADPILPFQKPIEQRLTNEIALGIGPQDTLNKALNAYHKTSKSLNGDLSILSNLNGLLNDVTGYPPLVVQAADDYMAELHIRNVELTMELIPAPLTDTRKNTTRQLTKVETTLSKAATAAEETNTTSQISKLSNAASQQKSASNMVQQSLGKPIGLSSMNAYVGSIYFKSSKGTTVGGTNFTSRLGTAIGEVSPLNNTLTFSAVNNGSVIRGFSLHVEGISLRTPAVYPLGVGENTAFYDATDSSSKQAYHFQGLASLTNGLVPFAYLAIDYIGSNYMIGSFAFVGTNTSNSGNLGTNTTASVYQAQFQLNFNQ